MSENSKTLKRLGIFTEIHDERRRQDEQWGGPEHDDRHDPRDWEGFIVDFASATRGPSSDFRGRMIRVAALAVAAIESNDRLGGK